MNAYKILIIEDDEIVARTIERSLRCQDFRVTLTNSGVEGLKIARRDIPDLVILDVIMPGMNGYAVCRAIREDNKIANIPILFLTAKIKDEDRITGFNAGADDYLTKPFNVDELVLRVRAILRRTYPGNSKPQNGKNSNYKITSPGPKNKPLSLKAQIDKSGQYLVVGDYRLDTGTFEMHTPGRGKLRLTPVQYDLLYHLMSHSGQVFSPARLLDEVWDYPLDTGSPDLVRVHIKKLRDRIETNPAQPQFIRTIQGFGYTINPNLE